MGFLLTHIKVGGTDMRQAVRGVVAPPNPNPQWPAGYIVVLRGRARQHGDGGEPCPRNREAPELPCARGHQQVQCPRERLAPAAVLNAAFLVCVVSAVTAILALLYYMFRRGLLGGRRSD